MWFVTIHPVEREYAKSVVVEEQFGGFRRIVAVADLQCHGRVHWKIGGRKFQRRLQFGFVSMLQILESARVDEVANVMERHFVLDRVPILQRRREHERFRKLC